MFLYLMLLLFSQQAFSQYDPDDVLTSQSTYCKNSYYNWPVCEDTLTDYTCTCGPGFYWNTHMCISDAVDSRLEFPPYNSSGKEKFAYALLLSKPFPRLESFTMSLYISLSKKHHENPTQCIFSYRYNQNGTAHMFSVMVSKKLEVTIHNEVIHTTDIFDTPWKKWHRLVITWASSNGRIDVYLDKKPVKFQVEDGIVANGTIAQGKTIESGGSMVLGQYPTDQNKYNRSLAFVGSLAHVNIWKTKFNESAVGILHKDCTFTHCGDGVEWVNLRDGTRGNARLKWPSGIQDFEHHCFSKQDALSSCDRYCSYVIGPQCKRETQESITWSRTKAFPPGKPTKVVYMPCPKYRDDTNGTDIPYANRSCISDNGKGSWEKPEVENCLSEFFLSFTRKIKSYMYGDTFDKDYVVELLTLLRNHTEKWTYDNPTDISATTNSLLQILKSQSDKLEKLLKGRSSISLSAATGILRNKDLLFDDAVNLADLHINIISHMLERRNDMGWNETRPYGQAADSLLQVLDFFTNTTATNMIYNVMRGDLREPVYRKVYKNIAVKISVMKQRDFYGVIFPDITDRTGLQMSDSSGLMTFIPESKYKKEIAYQAIGDDLMAVSTIRLDNYSRLLYDPSYSYEDNINTAVVAVRVYTLPNTSTPSHLSDTKFKMQLSFVNTANISNSECIRIIHGNISANKLWRRDSNPCKVVSNDSQSVSCSCSGEGFFTATSDMYNNYKPPEPPRILMTIPSYLGCSLAAFLAICTLGMLLYVGTSSRTAVMHEHFSVAVACNTLTFMIGITLTENETVCKSFAILFHYFFLAMFAWLMNESFNLYISITYTAHNQSTQENSGHWRYFIIGWGVPGVLVAAIVGSNFDTYFSSEMCWVSWSNIWLFGAPPLAMICVSLLVLTFAAKENNEVSYTKNESANKITEYHSNAIWTQIILITCTWAFAFLSLRFRTTVFKWVFFIFNSAQGAFLFVFFFLLNEEVRSVFKSKEIKQELGLTDAGQAYSTEDVSSPEESIPLTSQEDTSYMPDQQDLSTTPLLQPSTSGETTNEQCKDLSSSPCHQLSPNVTINANGQWLSLDGLIETCV